VVVVVERAVGFLTFTKEPLPQRLLERDHVSCCPFPLMSFVRWLLSFSADLLALSFFVLVG
jgi:hypothetical protein